MTWRKLSPLATVEHRLDERGYLLLRAEGDDARAPFTMAERVRDARGGFSARAVDALGYAWQAREDGWELCSRKPSVMTEVVRRWGGLAAEETAPLGLDARLVLATIACEAGAAKPDADGNVKAPRTERGYPRRSGEGDPGDFARDLEDWKAYEARGRRGTTHASHGLMQTLLSTAIAVRPELFAGVDPTYHRMVLWHPASSIACGAAHLASFPGPVLADPLATRIRYASGGAARVTRDTRWGIVVYDELVPLAFIAYWNDAARLREGAALPVSSPPLPDPDAAREPSTLARTAWIAGSLALGVLSIAALLGASRNMRHLAAST